ncbi:hypothetical protein BSAF29S_02885 [Bacillus safensis subsp. safensis]
MKLDLLPVEGIGTWEHLILPSITLAVPLIATYTRLLRSSVSEALQEPFVQYARIRGLKEQSIMFKHVFRMAIPALGCWDKAVQEKVHLAASYLV